jgi:superfamily II DNA or RNA helicase
MAQPELNEAYLANIGGWEALKRARGLLATGRVLSSAWQPPILRGVVQEGTITYRAGLVIKGSIEVENMCGCRESRNWGTICAHSLAVGLHFLKAPMIAPEPTPAPAKNTNSKPGVPAAPPAPSKPSPAPNVRRWRRAEEGEPLAIHLLLPPNLPEAVGRGKIMLVLEGQWAGGRSPLNALPAHKTFRLDPPDNRLLDFLEPLTGGEVPAMVQLRGDQFAGALDQLKDHPRISLGRSKALPVGTTSLKVMLKAQLRPEGEIALSLANPGTCCLGSEHAWLVAANGIQPVDLPKAYWVLFTGPLVVPRAQVPQFINRDWPALRQTCQVEANFVADDFTLEHMVPRFQLKLAGGMMQLEGRVMAVYGDQQFALGAGPGAMDLFLPDPARPTHYRTRDLAAEQAALGRLLKQGFSAPDHQGLMRLAGQNAVLNFFAREYLRLQKQWQVEMAEQLQRSTERNLERIETRFQVIPSGQDWFDLSVQYATASQERFSQADIQRLLLSGQSYQRLNNGRFALLDTEALEDIQEVLQDCAPRQHPQGYRFAARQAGYLAASLAEKAGGFEAPSGWREQLAGTRAPRECSAAQLGALDPVLRSYQKTGVAWLHFLRQNHLGGILADEMGLGKTLQTLAFIHTLKSGPAGPDSGRLRGEASGEPVLVVCPTSLVFNWRAEAQRFTPGLKLLVIDGPNREKLIASVPEFDLVITSYALMRRDVDAYRDHHFDLVVLDEAQHIKNRQSQNAQAVKAIRARQHLVLTGTPLENSVLDLWSIFDFLMPGYLGSARDFHERYEVPIAREKNVPAQARLARRVRPFLLRRMKREVATELPPKIEQTVYCELTPAQAGIYRQVLESSRAELVQAVDGQGVAKSRLLIFTALLRLRQVCCDLRLLKLESGEATDTSGKLDLFSELLDEVLDGGHRVLVFSQFVGMLGLLGDRLTRDGIEYCYLDGSTTDREAVVQQFQRQAAPVFLISLKAGGLGLNLSAADTVIHFDPWWNPAVEAQATDRAHRIGQTKVVTSYKLITRGTIEEKMLQLQARKRELFQAALGNDEDLAAALSWDEIQQLLVE